MNEENIKDLIEREKEKFNSEIYSEMPEELFWFNCYISHLNNNLNLKLMKEICGLTPKMLINRFNKLKLPKKTKEQIDKTREITSLLTFGESNFFKTDRYKTKAKNTIVEKYGSYKNLYDIRTEKYKKSNLEKYGFEYYFQTEEGRKRLSDINKNRSESEKKSIREKTKKTCLGKYGVESAFQRSDVIYKNKNRSEADKKAAKEKSKKTCLEKYGNEHYVASSEGRIVGQKTRLKKLWNKTNEKLLNNGLKILGKFKGLHHKNQKWIEYDFICLECGNQFKGFLWGIPKCPNCKPCNKSVQELDLFDFISKNTDSEVLSGTRKFMDNEYELDIIIPDKRVAFEYNGIYWHCALNKTQDYHKIKTEKAISKQIKLYHIWSTDNIEIIKSKIKNILGQSDKIFARKTAFKKISNVVAKEFFDVNHIHSGCNSKISFGLYHNEELISVISFRDHKEGLEIARFASKINYNVVGGFSKLFKNSLNYITNNTKYTNIISYCDRDWTPDYRDSVYFKNGFDFIKDSGCILRYTDKNNVYSREKFQKQKLKDKFPENYKEDKTANEILEEVGIYSVYNSGNWKFEYKIYGKEQTGKDNRVDSEKTLLED